MIERMAKAICCSSGLCRNSERQFAICQAHTFRSDARAAIAAMREPTEAMIAAGFDAIRMEENWPTLMGRVWQAMIDAALAEAPEAA